MGTDEKGNKTSSSLAFVKLPHSTWAQQNLSIGKDAGLEMESDFLI